MKKAKGYGGFGQGVRREGLGGYGIGLLDEIKRMGGMNR